MSDPEHVLYDLLPQQIQRVSLRNGHHNWMFPKVSNERFKNSFINRCLSQLFNWLLFSEKRGWVCLGSLIIPIYVHSFPFQVLTAL